MPFTSVHTPAQNEGSKKGRNVSSSVGGDQYRSLLYLGEVRQAVCGAVFPQKKEKQR